VVDITYFDNNDKVELSPELRAKIWDMNVDTGRPGMTPSTGRFALAPTGTVNMHTRSSARSPVHTM
jgi:hypothetical protein